MIKIILKPKNNSNNPQASKMIQITPEPPKYQNDQNTLKTTKIPWNAKMILIHPKLIKLPKYPENHENYKKKKNRKPWMNWDMDGIILVMKQFWIVMYYILGYGCCIREWIIGKKKNAIESITLEKIKS